MGFSEGYPGNHDDNLHLGSEVQGSEVQGSRFRGSGFMVEITLNVERGTRNRSI
jgi:hypothetical protein